MTCPCCDGMAAKCYECGRVLCDWHWTANMLGHPLCIPACGSAYWCEAKSRGVVLSEVKARNVGAS